MIFFILALLMPFCLLGMKEEIDQEIEIVVETPPSVLDKNSAVEELLEAHRIGEIIRKNECKLFLVELLTEHLYHQYNWLSNNEIMVEMDAFLPSDPSKTDPSLMLDFQGIKQSAKFRLKNRYAHDQQDSQDFYRSLHHLADSAIMWILWPLLPKN